MSPENYVYACPSPWALCQQWFLYQRLCAVTSATTANSPAAQAAPQAPAPLAAGTHPAASLQSTLPPAQASQAPAARAGVIGAEKKNADLRVRCKTSKPTTLRASRGCIKQQRSPLVATTPAVSLASVPAYDDLDASLKGLLEGSDDDLLSMSEASFLSDIPSEAASPRSANPFRLASLEPLLVDGIFDFELPAEILNLNGSNGSQRRCGNPPCAQPHVHKEADDDSTAVPVSPAAVSPPSTAGLQTLLTAPGETNAPNSPQSTGMPFVQQLPNMAADHVHVLSTAGAAESTFNRPCVAVAALSKVYSGGVQKHKNRPIKRVSDVDSTAAVAVGLLDDVIDLVVPMPMPIPTEHNGLVSWDMDLPMDLGLALGPADVLDLDTLDLLA